jgi:hypothetical protein
MSHYVRYKRNEKVSGDVSDSEKIDTSLKKVQMLALHLCGGM